MTAKRTLDLNWLVHQPARLGMMMLLAEHPRRFVDFRHDLSMNDGSIVRHTEYLQAVGYLTFSLHSTTNRDAQGRTQRKVFTLTDDGREALANYHQVVSEVTAQLGQLLHPDCVLQS